MPPTSLPRVLEPESMDSHEEAMEYERMDHSAVNEQFVDDMLAAGDVGQYVIDLGCGPAAIPIVLCERLMDVQVIAIDSSISMLETAKIQIDFAGQLDRVSLELADVKEISDFEESMADTVMSNSLLHHLADPSLGLSAALYLTKPGGRVFIRDLARPETNERVEELVKQYAGEESEFAQQLLRQSFHAALTIDEIKDIAVSLNVLSECVQMSSDRHWTIDWRNSTDS